MKKLKLIWDFTGPDALRTAEHHEHHLQEFIEMENLKNNITGVKDLGELDAVTYMVVDEDEMLKVRDALKPNRGEWYEG